MIRCINHLEEHQSGEIIVDGKAVTEDLRKIDEVRSNGCILERSPSGRPGRHKITLAIRPCLVYLNAKSIAQSDPFAAEKLG